MPNLVINGVTHVWSIHDNAWVTLEYWNWLETERRKLDRTVK